MFTQPENAHSKKEIRRALRLARKMQPENQRKRRELQANRQLKSHIKRGKRIAVYWGIGSELRLDHFIQAAKNAAHTFICRILSRILCDCGSHPTLMAA